MKTFCDMSLKVMVAPNPFSTDLAVIVQSAAPINIVVRLLTANGAVVRVKGCALETGENELQLNNLGKYVPGDYQIEVKLLNGDLVAACQVLKQ